MTTLWKAINDITKFKKTIAFAMDLLNEAGIKITHRVEIANLLDDCFSKIGQKMADKIDKLSRIDANSTNPFIANTSNFFLFQTTNCNSYPNLHTTAKCQ